MQQNEQHARLIAHAHSNIDSALQTAVDANEADDGTDRPDDCRRMSLAKPKEACAGR